MIISGDDPVSRGAQRLEVFTGAGKRREWPPEVKASIIAECYSGREGVSAVARRHGLDPSQLYAWRRDLRQRFEAAGVIVPPPEPEVPSFVPAVVEPSLTGDPASKHRPRRRRRVIDAAVELEMNGVTVKIGRSADAGTITAVIDALTRRPRYGCRSCESAVVQAPAPARIIEGGIPTEALIAQVLVAKYADHLPLYRQAQIYARQGIQLDRSTLADWVRRAAWYLRPLRDHILDELQRSERLFADETTAPVLDPGRGRTKTGQLWAYARDDRPWGGCDPPMVAYVYALDRKAERPRSHLGDFAGILQVDGYSGYAALARRRQQIRLAFCWAHVRRKFYELADSSPIATEVLRRIALLYGVEDNVRGSTAEQRCAVRVEHSRAIVDDLHQYLAARGRQVNAKSKLGEAIRYALTRWNGLSRFVEDGRIDLDSNTVERSIRPLALNRKNALFAGSDEGGDNWAVIATLIENCKISGINPHEWLTETLTSLANGHPANAVGNLMPWADVA